MRIVLSVFFLVWVCVVLVWDYACRPGVKTNTMAALVRVRSVVIRGSNQHHHRRNIIIGFIFTIFSEGGVRGELN